MPAGLPVALVGFFLAAFGLALVVAPRGASARIARTDRAVLQASGGAVRIGAGLALLYGADATAYPEGVFLFGTILVCAGVLVLAVSPKRFAGWIDRWLGGSMVARLRVGGLLSASAGALLLVSIAV